MRAMRVPLILALVSLAGGLPIAAQRWWTSGSFKLPAAGPSTANDPVTTNAQCESCHADVSAEWRGSQHQTAFSDPVFASALAVEDKAFCRGCHAPEDTAGRGSAEARDLGVACVTCHLQGPYVLAPPDGASLFPPHRSGRSSELATSAGCAGCHSFSFGDDDRRSAPLPMQDTVREHAESKHAARSCADCHMPKRATGGRSHSFASTRDQTSHRAALQVRAERNGAQVDLVLRNEAGHAYPTGDLFRRVKVEVRAALPDGRPIAARRYLARHFGIELDVEGRAIRGELRDDRVFDEASISLDLGPQARGLTIDWSVELERVLHLAAQHEDDAVVESRVTIARGTLAPPSP
jgi:hypothetical protein